MMRSIFAILFVLFLSPISSASWAEGGSVEGLVLADVPINQDDMESIKRGAKFFATTCMTCHTLVYLRYDKLAQEAGITYDKMPLGVKNWPYGVTPPDLSLEASVRGRDWIYTYLHSFYKDTTRPTGANNLLLPNTAMPAILSPYQGVQELVADPQHDLFGKVQWYDALELMQQGSMTPEQFDELTADLANFLAYAAEPYHNEQQRIGFWVIGFLLILFVFAYLLKREYWKDVKKHKKD
jgi:ubiquinol-cytochrome c reductase cytochrome c1 subunit